MARAARHDVIAEHGYVLTLGRYVGAEDIEEDGPLPRTVCRGAGDAGETVRQKRAGDRVDPQRLVDITVLAE